MKGSITVDAMIGLLAIILTVGILYIAQKHYYEDLKRLVVADELDSSAAQTSLIISIYRYSISHGHSDLELKCAVSSYVQCINESYGIVVTKNLYTRKGGGN